MAAVLFVWFFPLEEGSSDREPVLCEGDIALTSTLQGHDQVLPLNNGTRAKSR